MNRLRPLLLLLSLVLILIFGGPAPSWATSSLTWTASVDGHDVASATSNSPLTLDPARPARVSLDITNTAGHDVQIRGMRLEGRVMGLSFFSFTTRIDAVVHAGETTHRDLELDLGDLQGQAVGLIPARLTLLSPGHEELASRSLVTDVRGSVTSVYGTFGLVVLLVTTGMGIGLALAVARGRLPLNRWQRAVRFLPVGIGLGLTATFSLSSTRLLTPGGGVWGPAVLGCGAVAFLIGYLTPNPALLGVDRRPDGAGTGDGFESPHGLLPHDVMVAHELPPHDLAAQLGLPPHDVMTPQGPPPYDIPTHEVFPPAPGPGRPV